MKTTWIFRDYKKGDEIQIVDLFERVFGKKMTLDFWKWRFVENPFGEGIIKLLFDNNLLIGHYAVIPMVVQVKNTSTPAAFSMTTMTHPDYQGQGIFTYLAKETYSEAQKRGFKFVYGFPNQNSYYRFIKKLGWMDFGKMTVLYKDFKEGIHFSIRGANNIYEIKKFTDDIDSLWKKVRQNYQVVVPRTKEFLNWRFINNPEINYKIFSINNDKELLGYIIVKIYKGTKETLGHIVDILSVDEKVAEELLQASYNYFSGNGIQKISCWMQNPYFYSKLMEEEGFVRKIPDLETYFGVKILSENNNVFKEVEYFNNWYLTMGDSDVF